MCVCVCVCARACVRACVRVLYWAKTVLGLLLLFRILGEDVCCVLKGKNSDRKGYLLMI